MKVATKSLIIKCPKCGRQYLPAEIYYPNSFFGKPMQIDKNEKGEVEYYNGKSMDLVETYMCDSCNSKFQVTADISFSTSLVVNEVFSEVYSTPLFENKLELSEDF